LSKSKTMFIKQLYTNCLSEAAYFIASEGEAAVIDPVRDIDAYLELAKEHNVTIKYIFETHFHADFVSGHLDLAAATHAPIVYGPNAETGFPVYLAKDEEQFKIGKVTLKVLHTPGHTLESSCYLLLDENQQPHSVFTGDTLFVGDVGRPDLFSGNLSKEELAGLLFDSLNTKIKTLPDHVTVYPAHGPGSACGKNLGPDTYSTIGDEKRTNYALLANEKDEFIQVVTTDLAAPPSYFPVNAKINKEGYDALQAIMEKSLKPLTVADFKRKIKEEVLILDTRNANEFAEGFVPTSISIGLEGRFAEWAGSLLPFDQEIILVTAPGQEEETVVRMARVGFDNVTGYLEGGFQAWIDAGESRDLIISIEPDELAMDIPHDPNLIVLDVRKPAEYADGHVKDAQNLTLSDMTDPGTMADFDDNHNLYVHCAGGYRSIIACSILKREGIHNLRNITGGFAKIKEEEGIEIVKEKNVLN
jgi:glyoxylase-like metal-dependent hydrolase (beta-lactamase superfamily II)/rhodanese-related sulfurtransferase